uniref:Uncharacterized protein n=1 Tax=Timema poppense TaxID=170557 RepID=A0A7R9CRP2_TIMPO|nr:unnamed protein product [Timema poppensis]
MCHHLVKFVGDSKDWTGASTPPHCSNSPKMAPKASLGVITFTGILTVMLFVRCGHSAHSTLVKESPYHSGTARSLTVTVFVQNSTHQEVFVTSVCLSDCYSSYYSLSI